jgi:hypothetical protein
MYRSGITILSYCILVYILIILIKICILEFLLGSDGGYRGIVVKIQPTVRKVIPTLNILLKNKFL